MYVTRNFAFLFSSVYCLHDLRKILFLFFETIWSKEWNVLWERIGFPLLFALLLVTERRSGCPRFIEPLSVPQEDCSNFRIIARCWQRSHCKMKTYCCQKDCLDTNRNAFDVFLNKKIQQNGSHGFVQSRFYSVSSRRFSQILEDLSVSMIVETVIFNNQTHILFAHKFILTLCDIRISKIFC